MAWVGPLLGVAGGSLISSGLKTGSSGLFLAGVAIGAVGLIFAQAADKGAK